MIRTKAVIILIIAAVIVGAIWWWQESNAPSALAPAPEEEATITNEAFDTTDWLTYRNEKYGFELKYPRDWRVIYYDEYRVGFTTVATESRFGFIPLALKNRYCDLEQEVQPLIENYKRYNPQLIDSVMKNAEVDVKLSSCSIRIGVDKNPAEQTIKDFLKENYLPYATGLKQEGKTMADAINRLVVQEKDGIERAGTETAFIKFWGGFDGRELWSDLTEKRQLIINIGKYVIFITDHIYQSTGDLFDEIVRTINLLPKN